MRECDASSKLAERRRLLCASRVTDVGRSVPGNVFRQRSRIEKNLLPTCWQSHLTSLRGTFDSGVPTGLNKLGGPGKGSKIVEVPCQMVASVLHLFAAGVDFLVESAKTLTSFQREVIGGNQAHEY